MANPSNTLDVNVRGKDELTPELAQIQSKIIRWVGAVSSAFAAIQVVAFPVTAIRAFEREMANVQKTTGFTGNQINQLGQDMIGLSRRIDVSATDLAKIAAAAGQMGLGPRGGVEGISAFTDSVARMSSVLDVAVDQAGADVGKLVSIFKLPIDQTERMVSSFNEIANNSTATGEQLLDVVKRIGDAAGTINLQQSIGLGAAGIDFGFSPEVVGTSINKIFADMQAKADKFSKFMGISTQEWLAEINDPQSGGINAFKLYLDRLRTMSEDQRAIAIRELSGTGRIGSLMNKFANDTSNAVLDRALGFAARGFETGTSALREQETVLNTLDAQTKIAANSFKALGITAGEAFITPSQDAKTLTQYMASLADALDNPSFTSFAATVGAAMKDVLDSVVRLVVGVSQLNINWENFVAVGKVWLGLKLADSMVSLASRGGAGVASLAASFGALRANLQTIANPQSASQLQAIIDKTKEANATATQGIAGALAQRAQYVKAIEDRRAATQALLASEMELAKAQVANKGAQSFQARATRSLIVPQQQVAAAAQALQAAQTSSAVQAVQQVQNQRTEQAEQLHQQRLAAIEAQYQSARTAAKAAGDEREIRRLRALRTEQIAEEEARNARSLTGIQSYYARRQALVAAATQAEIATRQQALAAAEASLLAAQATPGQRNATTGVVVTSAAVESLTDKVNVNKAALVAAETTANATAAAYSRVGLVMTMVTNGFRLLLRLAGPLLLLGTTIYTIVDATIGIDKVGAAFERFGKALGLVSEKSRQVAISDEERRKNQQAEAGRLEDLIALRQKYFDLSSDFNQSDGGLKSLDVRLGSDNADSVQRARQQVLETIAAASALIQSKQGELDLMPINRDQKVREIEELQQKIIAAEANVNKVADDYKGVNIGLAGFGGVLAKSVDTGTATKELQKYKDQLAAAQKEVARLSTEMESGLSARVRGASKDLTEMASRLKDLFSPESARLAVQFGGNIAAAVKAEQEAREAYSKAAQKARNGEKGAEEERLAAEKVQFDAINATAAANQALADEIARVSAQPGVSQATINSFIHLREMLTSSPELVQALISQLRQLQGVGTVFTGTLVSTAPPARNGDNNANLGRGAESEARRLVKARIELRKAQLEAETKLERDANAEMMRIIEDQNQNGLIAISRYYEKRQQLQLADNAALIKLAQQERLAIEEEAKAYEKESDKVRSQAQIAKIDGDIAALQQQRKFIANENARALADAQRSFAESLSSARLEIAQSLGGNDLGVLVNSLEGYQAQYRVLLNRMRKEAETRPELMPEVEKLETINRLRAVADAYQQVAEETQEATGWSERYATRLDAAYQGGLISQLAYNEGMDRQREVQMKILEGEIARQQALLDQIPIVDRIGLAYDKLRASIDASQTSLDALAAKGRNTARDINQSLSSELGDVLGNINIGDSWGEKLRAGLVSWLGGIQQMMGESIAQSMVNGANKALEMVGVGGGEGFGGMISSLLGDFGNEKTLGTPTNPMYVVDAAAAAGGLLGGGSKLIDKAVGKANESEDPIGSMIESLTSGIEDGGIFDSLTEGLSGLGEKFLGLFDGFGDSLGGMFTGLFDNLGGFFSDLFSSLSGGSGGGVSGFMSMFVGLFHGGGKVGHGSGRARAVNPGLFANAQRFHSGRLPGLRADEVPAILQKNETVRTADQEAALQSKLSGEDGEGTGSGVTNIWVVTPDQQPSMSANDVVVVVSDNIDRGGSLRKLIRTIR